MNNKTERSIDLTLSAKPAIAWRKNQGSVDADKHFSDVKIEILKRDHYICAGCNFNTRPSGSYPQGGFEVHHKDNNHENNSPDNLITVCPICHKAFHVGLAGTMECGQIIYCPWISQADLNNLVRTLFIAMYRNEIDSGDSELNEMYACSAIELYEELRNLPGPYDSVVDSDDFGDAALLGNVLSKMKPEVGKNAREIMKTWRLLPIVDGYRTSPIFELWERGIYRNQTADRWESFLKYIKKKET